MDSWYKKCTKEVTTDTTVVAIASNGDFLVAANINNLVPAVRPQTPLENAELHAEMQILRYANQERQNLDRI